jgi:hypothetical protein
MPRALLALQRALAQKLHAGTAAAELRARRAFARERAQS